METKKIITSALLITLIGAGAVKLKEALTPGAQFKSNKSTDNQDNLNAPKEYLKLSILTEKCRGCGKCVKIDPAHFELDKNIKKARVILSTNLDSKNLAMAIENCPAQVISLK